MKHKYPSKEEIMKILLKENPNQKNMEKLMFIIEHKKINNGIGIIKAELLKDKKIILKGSMTCIPKKSADPFNWDILNNGESFF